MSLEIKFTEAGLAYRREALKNGTPIKLKTFKVSKDDIDIDNLPKDLASSWIEKPITYYTPIGNTGLQLDMIVPANEAIEQGKSFGIYLEDGTCYMLGRAVGVFNPNLKQKYKVTIEFVNSDLGSYDLTFIENLQQDWNSIKNKPELFPALPLIRKPIIDVTNNRKIVFSNFMTDKSFAKAHDTTYIVVSTSEDMVENRQEIVKNDYLLEYIPQNLPLSTQIFIEVAFGADGHISEWANGSFVSSSSYINAVEFVVEGSPNEVPDNPEITISELPSAVGCDLDKIECRVMQNGNLVGSVVEITDLTLPIIVKMPDLEVSTTYSFECRGVSDADSVVGVWGSVEATTEEAFVTPLKLDLLEDGSCKVLYPFDNSSNDIGGVYNATWQGTAIYDEGRYGQCAKILGDKQYLTTDKNIISEDSNFTMSLWIKPLASDSSFLLGTLGLDSSSAGGGFGIGDTRGAEIGVDLDISVDNEPYYQFTLCTGKQAGGCIKFSCPLGIWTHVMLIYDGSKMYIYLNNELKGSLNHSAGWRNNGFKFMIARGNSYKSDYILHPKNVAFEDIRLYDKALNADERTKNYERG